MTAVCIRYVEQADLEQLVEAGGGFAWAPPPRKSASTSAGAGPRTGARTTRARSSHR